MQAAFARPPCPLLERLENYLDVVAVVVETDRGDRQHLEDPGPGASHQIQDQPVHGVRLAFQQAQNLGFEQVLGHDVQALQEHRTFGDEPIPVDLDPLDGSLIEDDGPRPA